MVHLIVLRMVQIKTLQTVHLLRYRHLICADGLKGLEDVISEVFPGTKLQRCTTHLKRNIISDVRNGDKGEVAEDLRQVFRTGDRNYTVEQAWGEWQRFCAKWGKHYRCNRKSGIHQNRQRGYIKNCNNRTSETVTTVHQKR